MKLINVAPIQTDFEIKQGESSDIYTIGVENYTTLVADGFTGRKAIVDYPLETSKGYIVNPVDLVINPTDPSVFDLFITPTESATLKPDKYYLLVAEIVNATTTIKINREVHLIFKVTQQAMIPAV